MKRFSLYVALTAVLFCGAFTPHSTVAQSNKALTLYTDALKRLTIYNDTIEAYRLTNKALAEDSTYMPASHLLARIEPNPTKAWIAAERALAADSNNHHLLETASQMSIRAGKYERAKQILSRLIKDGQEPEHFRLLAVLHGLSKEHDKAIAILDSAEVRFGTADFYTPVFSRMRLQFYLESGEVDKALQSAINGVESAPYDPESHLMLAGIYADMRLDSLAEVSYNSAINLNRKNPTAWFDYAGYLDSRKRYGEMLMAWRNVIELDEVPLQTKKKIVESITSKRDFYRKHFLLAEHIITRLHELYPNDIETTELYASHLIAANRVEEAVKLFKTSMDKKPTSQTLDRILEIENYLNRTDSLEKYTDMGLKLYPEKANFWSLKAWLQMQRNDNKGAIETLRSALQYAEDSKAKSTLWGNIGDQYYQLGETRKSYDAYHKALSYDLNNAMVMNNFAYHLSVTGKSLKQALQMAKRATELSPNNATYLDTLAWVYYKLGEFEQAKKVMQQAMSFDRDNSSELALHYGDILDALGNTFMAQTYWRKALERGADASKIESRIEAQKAREKLDKEKR